MFYVKYRTTVLTKYQNRQSWAAVLDFLILSEIPWIASVGPIRIGFSTPQTPVYLQIFVFSSKSEHIFDIFTGLVVSSYICITGKVRARIADFCGLNVTGYPGWLHTLWVSISCPHQIFEYLYLIHVYLQIFPKLCGLRYFFVLPAYRTWSCTGCLFTFFFSFFFFWQRFTKEDTCKPHVRSILPSQSLVALTFCGVCTTSSGGQNGT